MKTCEEIKTEFFSTLYELQNTQPRESLKKYLQTKLTVLFWILEDEASDEYGEQVENALND